MASSSNTAVSEAGDFKEPASVLCGSKVEGDKTLLSLQDADQGRSSSKQ